MADEIEAAGEGATPDTDAEVPDTGTTPGADQGGTDDASEATSDGEAEPAEEASEGEGASGGERYQKLLAKYGGDVEKMAEGIFEQQNSAARLNEKFERAMARIEQLETVRQPEPTPVIDENSPDLQSLRTEMDALNQEFVGNERQIAAIEKDYGSKERELIEIEGQIKIADEFKRSELEQVRRDLQAELRSLTGDGRTLKRENKGISKDYFALKKERSSVENRLKEEGARQAQNKLDDKARQTDFNRDWGTRIGQAADKLGIPKDAKIREHFDLAMTDKAIAVVPLLPGQRIGDIDAFLEEHGKQYVAVMKALGGAEIKKFSNVKLADAQRSAPKGSAAVAPKAPGKEGDWNWFKDRARKGLANQFK